MSMYSGRSNSWDMDEEDGMHDQLPSVEEVRTRAALQLARVDSIRSMSSPRSSSSRPGLGARQVSSPALFDTSSSPPEAAMGPKASRARVVSKRNFLVICFLVTFALLLGAIIGLAVGIAEGRREILNGEPVPPPPSRKTEVFAWLGENSLSEGSVLADDTTPQYKAGLWVADQDSLRVPLPKEEEDNFAFVQRYVLALVYFALNGPNWTVDWNFVSGRPTCSWNARRVAIDGRTFQLGTSCNAAGRVTALHIPGSELEGKIPTEIALLTHLKFLALNNNQISGTLPSELQVLHQLDYLAFHWNALTGTIPSWLSNFSNLRVLGLGNNQLTGSIPLEFQLLTNLVTLGLDDNLLTGNLDNLQDLRHMKRLYLEDNILVHKMDHTFLLAMGDVEELDLSDNMLSGTVPIHMFRYPSLSILDLHGNSIRGRLPTPISTKQNLTFLSLHSNQLTGTITPQLSNLRALKHLDLAFNDFTGPIPSELGTMSNLRYLFLAGLNVDNGLIPDWVGQLSNLQDLSLKQTNRIGAIPQFIGEKMKSLVLLDLDSNKLTGLIPTNLGLLRDLSYLLLNRNEDLSGTIPESIQRLTKLNILLVDRTSLDGNLNTICSQQGPGKIVGSDCEGSSPEVTCPCCTICCDDQQSSESCIDRVYLGQLDPIWENSYQRRFYQFGPDVIFGNE